MYTLASEFCLFFSDIIIDSLYFSYGRKDTVIIHSMLLWMLGAANLPNDTLSLLGLLHFIEAFLAHFITAYLIMQDLGCNIKLGHQMTLASGTVGDVLHPYEADQEDDEIDMILESINNMGQNNEVKSDQVIPSMHEQHDGIWPATPAPGLSKLALSTRDSVLSKKTKTTRRMTRCSCCGDWACILVLLVGVCWVSCSHQHTTTIIITVTSNIFGTCILIYILSLELYFLCNWTSQGIQNDNLLKNN